MKTPVLLLILALFFVEISYSQDISGDRIPTKSGDLIVHPISHATLVLQWNEKTIYIDPVGGEAAFKGIPAPDLILITDIHGDHLNSETLTAINTENAHIIVPPAVKERMTASEDIETIGNGNSTKWMDIDIKAIPMYNLPESDETPHPKGRGNGYVLTMGGKNIYISGDTEDIPEMRSLKNIDVAFICMNLPYTMDINQAADAVLAFKPAIVYPYHYRGSGGLSDVDEFKRLVNAKNSKIDVRLRNWYPAN